ncbi:MAG: hypothetical protein IMX01_09755 [Limnochordaceae bacterium]|nr:hypothetical protein [Limnochordaceae bacterium]
MSNVIRNTRWQWSGKLRSYPSTASQAAFLLGGIGTGNVSLGARGELRDWEIFNHPGKGVRLLNTHFAIWVRPQGGQPVTRILEARLNPPFNQSHGVDPRLAGGLPRLAAATLYAEYPLVAVAFQDDSLPVTVTLEAFTPFIPLNPDDSGIPGAVLRYRVQNQRDVPVEVTIVGSMMNPLGQPWTHVGVNAGAGSTGAGGCCGGGQSLVGGHVNQFREQDLRAQQLDKPSEPGTSDAESSHALRLRGLHFTSCRIPADCLAFGNLTLATLNPDVTVKPTWLRASWWDDVRDFWDDLESDGRLTDLGYSEPSADNRFDTGSLGICQVLAPGETKEFTFLLSWYFPNRPRGWDAPAAGAPSPVIRNHYAKRFADSWEVAVYLAANLGRLERETVAFHDAFFASTLPPAVLDAASANITVLRSPTCFWLENGFFMGWEGCTDDAGCCHGNCTHVWNYAQTLAFLFPSLERSMRVLELAQETAADGKMAFRVGKVFSPEYRWDFHAAADGQLGTIMRLYRDFKLSGDRQFLASLWEPARRALDYALSCWDTDGDLVPDGQQHNTYDIELYGPNPLTAFFMVGALRAAAEMAEALGDAEAAREYTQKAEKAASRADALLFNGEYYEQRLTDVNEHKYQFGSGCLSDQLLAQTEAHLYGLGYLAPREHVRSAAKAIVRWNFRHTFSDHVNTQRAYVFNDEEGLLLCTWPRGGRPHFPFPYSDEVWTGIEYEVATLLVYEGLVKEALAIVKAVRDRHDGVRRNPWNEVECGHHYARSMASWGLVVALAGFTFDMARGEMGFAPVQPTADGEFQCFWSTGKGWGVYRQRRDTTTGQIVPEVQVLYGDLAGVRVRAAGREWTFATKSEG